MVIDPIYGYLSDIRDTCRIEVRQKRKENQNSIDTSSNRTEAYIILSNEELNNKNRDLLEKVAESNAEKDILEDENERMEKSITYQRGLLHNFNTLNKLEQSLKRLNGKSNGHKR